MFRDREEALRELQRQLLEMEEEQDEAEGEEEPDDGDFDDEDFEDEDFDDEDFDDEADTPDFTAYNADRTDTDLDAYSDDVYHNPKSKRGCALWVILATAGVLLLLSYLLAKWGGML